MKKIITILLLSTISPLVSVVCWVLIHICHEFKPAVPALKNNCCVPHPVWIGFEEITHKYPFLTSYKLSLSGKLRFESFEGM